MASGAASLKRPLYPSSGDVSALSFGFYTTSEVRATSVVRVTHGVLFDASGSTPLENGLYDGRMGPIDRRQGLCATCGLSFAHLCVGLYCRSSVLVLVCFSVSRFSVFD